LAFKIKKIKTKDKNSALCLSENLASFTRYVSYTNRYVELVLYGFRKITPTELAELIK